MKRNVFIAMMVLFFGVLAAKADNDRVVSKDKLPVAAAKFLADNFVNNKISYVKEERDFLEKNFEVVFTDGSKIEFLRNGEWKEVDCRYSEVPASIVPELIRKYVKEHYPAEKILQIDRDRHDYEIRLSNRLELTFDKNYNIIDIDD